MAVVQLCAEKRCKICSHPERAKIETLLEHRHYRRKDLEGTKITAQYVIKKMADWGIENPNLDNIVNHTKKHLKFVEDSAKLQTTNSGRQIHTKLNAGAKHVDVDENLRWIISVGRAEIEDRMIRGNASGITTDHMLKATAELTRRQHNEAQHELLGALVGGIGHAIGAVPQKELNPVADVVILNAEDIIDSEITEAELVPSPPQSGALTRPDTKAAWQEAREKKESSANPSAKPPAKPPVSKALQMAREKPPPALLAEQKRLRKIRQQESLPEWVKTGRPVVEEPVEVGA